VCAECGKATPDRPNARYCSRACQQKAYRARHAHGDALDLGALREQVASLEAELAGRDAVIEALRAELAGASGTAAQKPSRDGKAPRNPHLAPGLHRAIT
jgi:hypothetical protein